MVASGGSERSGYVTSRIWGDPLYAPFGDSSGKTNWFTGGSDSRMSFLLRVAPILGGGVGANGQRVTIHSVTLLREERTRTPLNRPFLPVESGRQVEITFSIRFL